MSATKGLEALVDVLDIIKDPQKYDAKIQALKEATAKYQEVVEAVVELSKVNEYTTSITKREAESKAVLEAAKAEAEAIKNRARETSSSVVAKANAKMIEANSVIDKATEKLAQAEAAQAEVVRQKGVLDEQWKELDVRQMALDKAEKMYEEKVKRLSAALK